jgi:hypothetical protein
LSEVDLVEQMESSEHSDQRVVTYRLTPKGEKRQEDRFFGQPTDDGGTITDADAEDTEDDDYDYGRVFVPLVEVVEELNSHAPNIAATLYPGLDVLKDRVDDAGLRAAAIGQLGEAYKAGPDFGSATQSIG